MNPTKEVTLDMVFHVTPHLLGNADIVSKLK